MQAKGYSHRDIKAENILIDGKYSLKLADFGFATHSKGKDGSDKLHTIKGTRGYMAPELIAGKPYIGENNDIFGVGVLLFSMVAGHPPFKKASTDDVFYKLFCNDNEKFWMKMSKSKTAVSYSPNFLLLINSLLALNPELRLTLKEAKASKWVQEVPLPIEKVVADFAERKTKIEKDNKAKLFDIIALKKKKAEEAKKKLATTGTGTVDKTKAVSSVEAHTALKLFLPSYNVRIKDNALASRV
jgi:serine/threonine protein kinase